jgi:hypothetical protein
VRSILSEPAGLGTAVDNNHLKDSFLNYLDNIALELEIKRDAYDSLTYSDSGYADGLFDGINVAIDFVKSAREELANEL